MVAAAVFPTMKGPVMSSWTEIWLTKHEFCLIGPWGQTSQSKVRLFYFQDNDEGFKSKTFQVSWMQSVLSSEWQTPELKWCNNVIITMIAKPGSQRHYCQTVWHSWSCWGTGPWGQDQSDSFHWLTSWWSSCRIDQKEQPPESPSSGLEWASPSPANRVLRSRGRL